MLESVLLFAISQEHDRIAVLLSNYNLTARWPRCEQIQASWDAASGFTAADVVRNEI